MNILHVTKKYLGALGGDTVVVSSLQKHQEDAGHHVAILTSNCKEIKNGKHVHKFGLRDLPATLDYITLKRLISLVGLFFKAFVVFFKEHPHVIHTHSIDMAFFVSFAARFYKIPMIHTFHIVTFYDRNQPIIRRKSELWLAKAAGLRVITAPNMHDVTALHNAGLRQAVLLSNGIDLTFWQKDTPGSPDREKGKVFTFISVGRLEPQKGYEYIIKAAALLKKKSRQAFRITLVGEGRQKQFLQNLAGSSGVQDVVQFIGAQPAQQIRSMLSQADVAVFASLYETTPLTLLEAWAVGIPVIITPVGILRNTTNNAQKAYLVQPEDEQSLLATMELCMDNEALRSEIASKGHEEAKKYAWSGIAQSAELLYKRLHENHSN